MATIASYHWFDSPIGPLLAIGRADRLCALQMKDARHFIGPPRDAIDNARPFAQLRLELDEYFNGSRTSFSVALDPEGTPFQQSVWRALLEIPYGQTCSYADIAQRIGRPQATRAVGAANGKNPIAVIVPCHRVIGRAGDLTGYAGGLERKRRLLALEAQSAPATGTLWA